MDQWKVLMCMLIFGISLATPANAAVDLIINSISFNPTNPLVGQEVTVTVVTKNIGTTSTGTSFTTQVFNSTDKYPDIIIPTLAGGASKSNQVKFRCKNVGTFPIRADADAYDPGVPESNEENNEKTESVTCRDNRPELFINSFTASKSNPRVGEQITLTVVVRNTGNVASVASVTNIANSSGTLATQNVPILAAGATDSARNAYFTCSGLGPQSFTATADSTNTNPTEVSEFNNTKTIGITCMPGPDYVILPIRFSKTNPIVGETVTVYVITNNTGDASAASTSNTRLTKPGGTTVNFGISALAAGKNITNTTSYTCTTAGQATFSATADTGSAITETNEGNNVGTGILNCGVNAPDLVISEISFNPQGPKVGEPVTVTIKTKNIGTGPTTVITKTRQTLPLPVSEYTMPLTINAGSSNTNTFTYNCPMTPGQITFTAIADAYNAQTNELNEANNQNSTTLTCKDLANLLIQDIQISGGGYVNDAMSATVTTINIGQATTRVGTVTRLNKPGGTFSSVLLPALAYMGTHTHIFNFNCPATAGSYWLNATADYGNLEPELDEGNSKLKAFSCKNRGANLIVSLRWEVEKVKRLSGTVYVTTRNIGTDAATASQTSVGSSWFNIKSLAPGEAVTNPVGVTCRNGRASLTATADVGYTVTEASEIDNSANGLFSCNPNTDSTNIVAKGYDIQIGNLTISPLMLVLGGGFVLVAAWYMMSSGQKKPSRKGRAK